MSVLNRRNALFGWVVYQVGIRVIKRKARQAVPAIDIESRRANKSAIAIALASAVGVLTFWKLHSGGDDVQPPADAT
jgi:hypothetical protein